MTTTVATTVNHFLLTHNIAIAYRSSVRMRERECLEQAAWTVHRISCWSGLIFQSFVVSLYDRREESVLWVSESTTPTLKSCSKRGYLMERNRLENPSWSPPNGNEMPPASRRTEARWQCTILHGLFSSLMTSILSWFSSWWSKSLWRRMPASTDPSNIILGHQWTHIDLATALACSIRPLQKNKPANHSLQVRRNAILANMASHSWAEESTLYVNVNQTNAADWSLHKPWLP